MEAPASNQAKFLVKYKGWIVGILAALVIASVAYGITQLQYKKEHDQLITQQQQSSNQTATNETLMKQITALTKLSQAQQTKLDQIATSSASSDKNKTTTVTKTVYDPATGKLIEQLVTTINAIEKSKQDTKVDTHTAATTTVTITSATSSVVVAGKTTTTTTSATSTTVISDKTKVDVKPAASAAGASQMRFSVGAAYHNNRFKAAAGYTVPMLNVGPLVSVGPGLLVGNDLVGAAAQIDLLKLPRIGIGYGCDLKMKNCGVVESIGIRLDF